MGDRSRRAVLPALLVVLAATARTGAAEEPAAGPTSLRPPTEEEVARWLADPVHLAPAGAIDLAGKLKAAGGHASAAGLADLLRHRDACVRATALEGIAELGLRSEKAAAAVRALATSSDVVVRARALDALGRVGDGRDVAALLDGLSGEDAEVRAACLRGLRALTGMRLPASPMRWGQWWSKAEPRARADIGWAVQEMAVAVEAEGDLEPYAAALQRSGWVDLEAVRRAALSWIHSSDPVLRAQGFRVVGALRLADLAADVRRALQFLREEDAWAAHDAARVLGVVAEEPAAQPAAAAAR